MGRINSNLLDKFYYCSDLVVRQLEFCTMKHFIVFFYNVIII